MFDVLVSSDYQFINIYNMHGIFSVNIGYAYSTYPCVYVGEGRINYFVLC